MAAKKQKKSKEVTKDWTLGETLQTFPETMEVFAQYGMHCIGCSIAMHETIAEGAAVHGTKPEDLVKKINMRIKKERGGK